MMRSTMSAASQQSVRATAYSNMTYLMTRVGNFNNKSAKLTETAFHTENLINVNKLPKLPPKNLIKSNVSYASEQKPQENVMTLADEPANVEESPYVEGDFAKKSDGTYVSESLNKRMAEQNANDKRIAFKIDEEEVLYANKHLVSKFQEPLEPEHLSAQNKPLTEAPTLPRRPAFLDVQRALNPPQRLLKRNNFSRQRVFKTPQRLLRQDNLRAAEAPARPPRSKDLGAQRAAEAPTRPRRPDNLGAAKAPPIPPRPDNLGEAEAPTRPPRPNRERAKLAQAAKALEKSDA